MRASVAISLVLGLFVSGASAQRISIQLEWGFGPTPSEMLWDGEIRVTGGELVNMEAFSFESDKRDRLTPPTFRSFTQNNFSDGMRVIVEGDDRSRVRLKCLQGDFEWVVGDLRQKQELSFPGKDGGSLVVRLIEMLGEETVRLSDETTQDSDPAICLLPDGREIVVWRAFLGLPAPGEGLETCEQGSVGDQICLRVLDREGTPGNIVNVLLEAGDVEKICIAPTGNGNARVVWAEQRDKNWDLYSCTVNVTRSEVNFSPIERLTDEAGVDRKPALVATLDGSLTLAWQGWRDGCSSVFFRRCRNGVWDEPIALSNEKGNDWYPAIASSKAGAVAVSWFRWQNDSYDVFLCEWDAGRWGPVEIVASTDRYEALPSLAYDADGTLWIAYEEGRTGWGLDSHTAGLRSVRNVRVCCYRDGKLLAPTGTANLSLPEEYANCSEMAQLVRDGNDVLWLFFRRLRGRGIWDIFGTSLHDDGWSKPLKIDQSQGGQDVAMTSAAGADGCLRVVWTSDHRVRQFGLDNYVYTAVVPSRAARTAVVATEPVVPAAIAEASDKREERVSHDFDGRQFGPVFR